MLILYIMNLSPEKQSIQSVPVAASGMIRRELDKPLKITGATRSLSYSEEPMMVSEGRRMESAPPGGEELPLIEEIGPLVADEIAAVGDGMGVVELVLLIEPEARGNVDEYDKGKVLLSMQARKLRQDKTLSSEVKKEDNREAATLTRLKELITREGGEIISTEEMTDLTHRIAIKLPADRYHSFMEELSEIGDPQPDRMVPPEESERTIRLRLTRITHKN